MFEFIEKAKAKRNSRKIEKLEKKAEKLKNPKEGIFRKIKNFVTSIPDKFSNLSEKRMVKQTAKYNQKIAGTYVGFFGGIKGFFQNRKVKKIIKLEEKTKYFENKYKKEEDEIVELVNEHIEAINYSHTEEIAHAENVIFDLEAEAKNNSEITTNLEIENFYLNEELNKSTLEVARLEKILEEIESKKENLEDMKQKVILVKDTAKGYKVKSIRKN